MRWFPVVGFFLGGILVAGDYALSFMFAPPVVDVCLVGLLVLLTGGLHQDGLADMIDGLAGGHSPEDRLAIMRDGRIGAMGATGLVFSLALRYAGLAVLPAQIRWPVLLCMPAVGRWAMVIGAGAAPYARPSGGLAQPFLAQLSSRDQMWAGVPLLIMSVAFLLIGRNVAIVFSLALVVMITFGVALFSTQRVGGMTGDTLGATNECAEIGFLLMGPILLGGT